MREIFLKALVPLAFIFVFCLSFQVVIDTDYFWHLKIGDYIFETKTIPKQDLLSFSVPNYPYIYYEWGSEVLLAAVYRLFGNYGVSSLYAFAATLTLFLMYKTAYTISGKEPFLPIFVLFAPVSYAVGGGRLRSFGFLLLALVYFLFCKFVYKKSKIIWTIPLVFVLWVNLHGSFILGLAAFAICSILVFLTKKDLSQAKTLVVVNFLSFFATLFNPYVFKIWQQALLISTNYYSDLQYLNLDWQSLLAKDSRGWILAVIAFLTIATLFLIKNKVELWQKVLLIVFLILSLKTARFAVALYIFFLIPLCQLVLQFKEKIDIRGKFELYFLKGIFFLIFLVLTLGLFVNLLGVKQAYSSAENYSQFLKTKFPKKYSYMNWPYKAGVFVTENLKNKRVLNEANWGSLLLLLDPNIKLFYYGAMDNFVVSGNSFAVEYLSIVNAQGQWQDKLKKYSIDAVFLPPNFPLVEILKKDSNWQIIYEDEKAVVLVKN